MNGSCSAAKGLCAHEKMMLAVMVIAAIAGSGHWLFNWF
jgi:hypothetical protein